MATSRSSRKRIRQNRRRNLYNRTIKSAVKTVLKRLVTAIESKDAEKAKREFLAATQQLDRAAGKKLLHPNKVARTKSRLAARLKALAAAK